MKKVSAALVITLIIPLILLGCGRKRANQAFTRGTVLLQQGKPEEARAEYERALQLYPKHHQAYYGIGVVDMTEGKYQQALEQFDKAIALKSDFASPYYQKARSYAMLDQPELALDALETAIALDRKWLDEALNDKVLAKLKSEPRFNEITAH